MDNRELKAAIGDSLNKSERIPFLVAGIVLGVDKAGVGVGAGRASKAVAGRVRVQSERSRSE